MHARFKLDDDSKYLQLKWLEITKKNIHFQTGSLGFQDLPHPKTYPSKLLRLRTKRFKIHSSISPIAQWSGTFTIYKNIQKISIPKQTTRRAPTIVINGVKQPLEVGLQSQLLIYKANYRGPISPFTSGVTGGSTGYLARFHHRQAISPRTCIFQSLKACTTRRL